MKKVFIKHEIYFLGIKLRTIFFVSFDTDNLSLRITQNRLQLLSILLLFCENKQLTNMLISHTAEKCE